MNNQKPYFLYALLFISGFIFALSLGQAFSLPLTQTSDGAQITPNDHRTFQLSTWDTGASVDEHEAERLARIEWIERNGDIPPAPSQADLEYMQRYTEQLQAQYNKGEK